MKSIAWFYMKMFLLMGFGFGLLMSLGDLLLGSGFQLDQFIYRSVSFGAFMSVITVSTHILRLRSLGVKEFSSEILNPVQKRIIISKLNKNQIREKIVFDPTLNKMELHETEKGIMLRSNMTLFSFGNRIYIENDGSSGDEFTYDIISKPILVTTLLDYGTSYQQMREIEKLMVPENSN